MPLRNTQFAPGEYYHLCVRGNNKQEIFRTDDDRYRMLFLITHLQSPITIPKIKRITDSFRESGKWDIEPYSSDEIVADRYIALHAFAFMTNHLHIAVREEEEGGITRYMQRVLNAYAKYFNTKYETVGHLFQGPYRAVHIEDNEQLLYLSTYIHRNPRELPGIAGMEDRYAWSSYQDYLGKNRFGELLDRSLVLDQFDDVQDYRAFVDDSVAKEDKFESFLTA
jgi:putative transposase